MYNEVIAMIAEIKGNGTLLFNEPVTVRVSDNAFPLEIYGLGVSPKKELHIMTLRDDGRGKPMEWWDKMEPTDANIDKLLPAINKRVQLIYGQAVKPMAV
jgi:hypothetical protein